MNFFSKDSASGQKNNNNSNSNKNKKNTVASGNAGDVKKPSHWRPHIYLFNRFSRDILYSSLVSFAFLYSFSICLFVFSNEKYIF